MTSGPRPPAHDAEETPTSSDESLEELTERTAEVMDDARKQVNRARETFHDQIISSGVGVDDVDYARHQPEPGPDHEPASDSESVPEPEPESVPKPDSESVPEPALAPEPEPASKDDHA